MIVKLRGVALPHRNDTAFSSCRPLTAKSKQRVSALKDSAVSSALLVMQNSMR